jgi:hypothetical protein
MAQIIATRTAARPPLRHSSGGTARTALIAGFTLVLSQAAVAAAHSPR